MASGSIALKIFWSIVMVLFVGGVGVLLVRWFRYVLRVKAEKNHSIRIVNNGNFPSLYHLSIKSTQPELTFKCLYNNIPLVPVFEEVVGQPVTGIVQSGNLEQVQKPANTKKKAKAGKVNPDGALKAGKSVSAKSGVAASLLGTLGSLLPGKLGAGLKEKADMARSVQIKTAKVTQAPQAATNKMDALKSSSGRLGVGALENKGQRNSTGSVPAASQTPSNQVVISLEGTGDNASQILNLRDTGLVKTRELGSGEELMLTLIIGTSKKRFPAGSFNYVVQSQQVPVHGRFDSIVPVSKTGTVYFKPISNFRYLLPMIGSSIVFLLALLGIYYGLIYLWG